MMLSFGIVTLTLISLASCLSQASVDDIRAQIRKMIDDEPIENGRSANDLQFLGGLVRLSFHDCVGDRCDGCINNNHSENAGLEVYINRTEQLYTNLEVNGERVQISRADFWALAGIEAVFYSNDLATCTRCPEHLPNITFRTGRVDCPTSPTTTEVHEFPSALGDTKHVLEFFEREFGFDAKEATAILGAHTLGRAHREASGFVHPWVQRKDRLDNAFYVDLKDPDKGWAQRSIGRPDEELWFWENAGDKKQLMLNTDMALIRNLSSMSDDGQVTCTYTTCPVVSTTSQWVDSFAANNTLWIDEFSLAFEKMIEKGWSGQLSETGVDDPVSEETTTTATSLHTSIATTTRSPAAASSTASQPSTTATPSQLSLDQATVDDIRAQIRKMIDDEPIENGRSANDLQFLGGLVRLSFHDCVGDRCDGCINNNHSENAGLEVYINRTEQLYTNLEVNGERVEISRADFWALAGIEAVFYSNDLATCTRCPEHLPNITFRTGRVDCPTSPTTTEVHEFPSALGDTKHVLEFFEREFGFDEKEATAILGAHTLGKAHREASGFVHPWVQRQDRLDNAFYVDLRDSAKNWTQRSIGRPDEELWFWENAGDRKQLMLNTDMALIRNLSSMSDDGQVTCTYTTCPVVSTTSQWVDSFAANNNLWIDEFSLAFEKMIEKGWSGRLSEIGSLNPTIVPTISPTSNTTESSASLHVAEPFLLSALFAVYIFL